MPVSWRLAVGRQFEGQDHDKSDSRLTRDDWNHKSLIWARCSSVNPCFACEYMGSLSQNFIPPISSSI